MRNKTLIAFLLLIAILGAARGAVLAQDETVFDLNLRRDWGYGMGSDIQGRMSLSLAGDLSQVSKVDYYVDDNLVSEQTEAPFRYAFNTDDYTPGQHKLIAQVHTSDGQSTTTAPLVYNFISAQSANKTTVRLVGGILAVTILVSLVSFLIARRTGGKDGKASSLLGLAICTQCGQTFPRSIFRMNLVAGKFERCPHCGKWQLTQRASAEAIQQADRANQPEPLLPPTIGEQRDELEDSRFTDL